METKPSNSRGLAALLLFIASLALFLATTSNYAMPGESSAFLIQHTGLVPFPPMAHVVWGSVIRLLAALRLGPLALLPNIFSALCGAGCIALIFLLVSRLTYNLDFDVAPVVRTVSGAAASAYAAVTVPFWSASNRAHPASFGILLLLASLHVLLRYRDGARRADLYTFGLVFSVAFADFSTCMVFAPALALYALLLMKRHRQLKPGPLLALAACGLLPVALVYLLAALQYAHSPASAWREFASFWQMLKFFPREQGFELIGSIPRQGWLLSLVCTFVPWATCLFINRRGGYIEGGAGSYMLHAFMLASSVLVLFHGPVSPRLAGAGAPLPVTLCLMSATCFGYAIGYVLALYLRHAHRFHRTPSQCVAAAAVFAAGCVTLAGVLNAAAAGTASAREMHVVGRAVLESLAGRPVVITHGLLDAALLIEAHDARQPLELVNAEETQGVAYRRYVASLVPTPRLQGLAMAGLMPMLMDWLRTGQDIESHLATQVAPDFWLAAGFQIIPHEALYLGARRLAALDANALMAEHRKFWDTVLPPLRSLAARGGPGSSQAVEFLPYLSRVANDLGILLENLDRPDDAERVYREAFEIEPGNVIARVNLHDLYARRGETNQAALTWIKIDAALAKADARPDVGWLLSQYGHVRTREGYESLIAFWSTGAAPAADDPDLVKAINLYAAKKTDEAKAAAEALVEQKPELDTAWILLATLAYEKGDEQALKRCVERMHHEKKQWLQIYVILANDALRRQDYASAREYLEMAARLRPDNVDILEKLVTLYQREGSVRQLDVVVRNLLTMDPDQPVANYALGCMLVDNKEDGLAEESFRKVTVSSSYAMAQAKLAGLLRKKGQRDEAYLCAQRAVEMDAGLSEAWDALAKSLTDLKKPEEAAQAQKKALELKPVNPLPVRPPKGEKEETAEPSNPLLNSQDNF